MFTVEEMNLIQAMDHTCRRMSIFDMKTSIPNIEDADESALRENAEEGVGHDGCGFCSDRLCRL